jgi:hypothetical protein
VRDQHRVQLRNVGGGDRELDHHRHVEAACRRSTISVVPRLLIKNQAMPSHGKTVPSPASKASAPNGCVLGARACRWMAGPYRDGKAVTTTRQSEPAAETAHAGCYLSQGELSASPLAPFGIRFQALAGVVIAGLGRGGGRRAVAVRDERTPWRSCR